MQKDRCVGRGNVIHLVVLAAGLLVAGCSSGVLGRPARLGATPVPVPALDPRAVAGGRRISLRTCASCHGQHAEGAPNWQQTDARGDLPPPPHDDRGHTWRHSDAQLAEIIRNGMRDPFNKTPELTMPPFKGRLSDAEVRAVITYFKSLWSAEHRAFQEEQNRRPPMPTPTEGT